jgi:hypothetical protein
MSEFRIQVLLTIATAAMAVLILTPTFFAIKLLLDAGLEFVFGGVVSFGILLGFILRRETTR